MIAKPNDAERVLIMGAAGRDFHTFNVCFRGNPDYRVVAFTAAQIPGIENRHYSPVLSGALYPEVGQESDSASPRASSDSYSACFSHTTLTNLLLWDHLKSTLPPLAFLMERPSL